MSVKVAAGSEHYYAPEAKGAQLAVSWLSLSSKATTVGRIQA